MLMNILVMGGTGFIGGHLAESLVRERHAVTVLDNLDPNYDTGIKQRTIELSRQAAECSKESAVASDATGGKRGLRSSMTKLMFPIRVVATSLLMGTFETPISFVS